MAEKVVGTTLLARGIPAYVGKMRAAAAANVQFGASAVAPSAKAGGLASRMGGVASSAGLISPALLGAGGAVFAIKSVVGAAVEWESAFAGVEKTVEGTDAQLAALSGELRDMSTEIPVTAEELAGIAESAGQLGIETGNVAEFTRVMADLGVATNMTSEHAATALARFGNITQMPQGDFDRLGATVVDLGNNLATTEEEIVEMALRLAGAANQAGFTEAEILGLAGALSSVGIRAEAGGTAFSKVIIDMSASVEEGGEKLDKFAEIAGMSAQKFAESFRDDPAGAVTAFVQGLGSASDAGEDLFGILGDLGIEEIRMRDALLRTAGAGDVLSDSIGRGNDAWEENIALTEEAARRYGTTASKWEMVKNQFKEVSRTIGEDVKPALDKILDDVNRAFDDSQVSVGRMIGGAFLGDFSEVGKLVEQEIGRLDDITPALKRARDATAEFGDHMGRMPKTISEAGEAAGEAAGDVDGLSGSARGGAAGIFLLEDSLAASNAELDESVTKMEAYQDMIARNIDPVYNLHAAIRDVEAAQDDYNGAVDEFGEGSAEAQDAAFQLARKVSDVEAAVLDGNLSFSDFEGQLARWVSQGAVTADQADAIRGRVVELRDEADEYDGSEFTADFTARLDRRTINDIERELSYAARTRTSFVNVQTRQMSRDISRELSGRAAGGPVSAGVPYIVGEKRPEVFVPDTSGTILPSVTGTMLAGSRTGTSQQVNITLQMDGRTVARSRGFIDELGKFQATSARNVAA